MIFAALISDKCLLFREKSAKIERRGKGLEPLTAPNHSEPAREVRHMADASQYTDSTLYFNKERSANGGAA